jgi:hypothetical protein
MSRDYLINTATKNESETPHMHWRLRIVPQLTYPAGLELGSGLSINPSLPERRCIDPSLIPTPARRARP